MRNRWVASLGMSAVALLAGSLLEMRALAQADDCKNRGQLDTLYCDDNSDLVADRAEGSEEAPRSVDAGVRLHAGRRPRGLRPVFKPFTDYLAQCTGKRVVYYPVQFELGRDRGDALGPAACRRLLDRADRLRGQPRRRGAVRGQGHREGPARLSSDLAGRRQQPLPEALRPQGQARRPHVAVIELRQSRAARALSPGRPQDRTRTTSR